MASEGEEFHGEEEASPGFGELFLQDNGSPMIFSMQDEEGEEQVSSLIKSNGGQLVSSIGGPHTIQLFVAGRRTLVPSARPQFKHGFIQDSVKAMQLQKLSDYRADDDHHYDSVTLQLILLGLKSWKELELLPRLRLSHLLPTSPPSPSAWSSEDEEDKQRQTQGPVVHLKRKKRREFTHYDRLAIVRYILKRDLASRTRGRHMWEIMARANVVPGRTWQSLKEHYRRMVVPKHLPELGLTAAQMKDLAATESGPILTPVLPATNQSRYGLDLRTSLLTQDSLLMPPPQCNGGSAQAVHARHCKSPQTHHPPAMKSASNTQNKLETASSRRPSNTPLQASVRSRDAAGSGGSGWLSSLPKQASSRAPIRSLQVVFASLVHKSAEKASSNDQDGSSSTQQEVQDYDEIVTVTPRSSHSRKQLQESQTGLGFVNGNNWREQPNLTLNENQSNGKPPERRQPSSTRDASLSSDLMQTTSQLDAQSSLIGASNTSSDDDDLPPHEDRLSDGQCLSTSAPIDSPTRNCATSGLDDSSSPCSELGPGLEIVSNLDASETVSNSPESQGDSVAINDLLRDGDTCSVYVLYNSTTKFNTRTLLQSGSSNDEDEGADLPEEFDEDESSHLSELGGEQDHFFEPPVCVDRRDNVQAGVNEAHAFNPSSSQSKEISLLSSVPHARQTSPMTLKEKTAEYSGEKYRLKHCSGSPSKNSSESVGSSQHDVLDLDSLTYRSNTISVCDSQFLGSDLSSDSDAEFTRVCPSSDCTSQPERRNNRSVNVLELTLSNGRGKEKAMLLHERLGKSAEDSRSYSSAVPETDSEDMPYLGSISSEKTSRSSSEKILCNSFAVRALNVRQKCGVPYRTKVASDISSSPSKSSARLSHCSYTSSRETPFWLGSAVPSFTVTTSTLEVENEDDALPITPTSNNIMTLNDDVTPGSGGTDVLVMSSDKAVVSVSPRPSRKKKFRRSKTTVIAGTSNDDVVSSKATTSSKLNAVLIKQTSEVECSVSTTNLKSTVAENLPGTCRQAGEKPMTAHATDGNSGQDEQSLKRGHSCSPKRRASKRVCSWHSNKVVEDTDVIRTSQQSMLSRDSDGDSSDSSSDSLSFKRIAKQFGCHFDYEDYYNFTHLYDLTYHPGAANKSRAKRVVNLRHMYANHRTRPRGPQYSSNEDASLLRNIKVLNPKLQLLGGNEFWRKMEKLDELQGRSWQSLRTRYHHVLRGKLGQFAVGPDEDLALIARQLLRAHQRDERKAARDDGKGSSDSDDGGGKSHREKKAKRRKQKSKQSSG